MFSRVLCTANGQGMARAAPAPSWRAGSAEAGEQLSACGLAAPAGLGTDPAVLVHRGVACALVAARLAGGGAGLEHRAGEVGVVAGVPGQHPEGGVADVGAVGAGADALGQLGDHVLTQAGVGAGGARLSAVQAGLDAVAQLLLVDAAEVLGVRAQHLSDSGHGEPPLGCGAGRVSCPLRRAPMARVLRQGWGDKRHARAGKASPGARSSAGPPAEAERLSSARPLSCPRSPIVRLAARSSPRGDATASRSSRCTPGKSARIRTGWQRSARRPVTLLSRPERVTPRRHIGTRLALPLLARSGLLARRRDRRVEGAVSGRKRGQVDAALTRPCDSTGEALTWEGPRPVAWDSLARATTDGSRLER